MGDVDFNSLLRLKEALEGAQKNTNKMLVRLERFEKRLSDLDDKMKPIQATTSKYMRAKNNISQTLHEVGKTYEYFRVANDVKEVVSRGYNPASQKEFLDAFRKLSQAKIFFQEHKEIKSAQSVLSNIESLLQSAISSSSQELDNLLGQSGRCARRNENSEWEILNPFTSDASKDIKQICEVFDESHSVLHYKQYQAARIAKIRSELKELETAQAIQWNSLQSEDPYQRENLPFADLLSLCIALLRGEYQLWTTLLPMNEDSMGVFLSICDCVLAEMQRMFTPLLSDTAAKSRAGASLVIRQTKMLLVRFDLFEAVNHRFDELRDVCHPDARHESSASLALVRMRQNIVMAAVQCVDFLTSNQLGEGFVLQKKGGGSSAGHDEGVATLSCDLHPVTGHVLFFARALLSPEYAPLYRKILELASTFVNDASSTVAQTLQQCAEAEDAIFSLLDHLFVALETRAERFDDHSKPRAMRRSLATNHHALFDFDDKLAEEFVLAARKHLFLLNNMFAILSFARDRRTTELATPDAKNPPKRSGGRGGTQATQASRQQRLAQYTDRVEQRVENEQALFCETIAMALGLATQDMSDFSAACEKDKSSQGRLLKAKFSMFNTGLDAFLAQQGEWRISSPVLRERLTQQLLQRVSHTYSAFFSQFSAVKFSKKHMNEYLKYTPAQLEQHIRNFFGRSA